MSRAIGYGFIPNPALVTSHMTVYKAFCAFLILTPRLTAASRTHHSSEAAAHCASLSALTCVHANRLSGTRFTRYLDGNTCVTIIKHQSHDSGVWYVAKSCPCHMGARSYGVTVRQASSEPAANARPSSHNARTTVCMVVKPTAPSIPANPNTRAQHCWRRSPQWHVGRAHGWVPPRKVQCGRPLRRQVGWQPQTRTRVISTAGSSSSTTGTTTTGCSTTTTSSSSQGRVHVGEHVAEGRLGHLGRAVQRRQHLRDGC